MRQFQSSKDSNVVERERRSPLALLLLGFILGIVALVFLVRQARPGPWDKLVEVLTARKLVLDASQPSVVEKIQRLQRLETVNYSLEKIVEGERQSSILPDFLAGDKLLMVVHGQVIAGIDLSQLRPQDVHMKGRSIQVHLPPAQIFVTTLDNTQTRVYSRTTGLLVPVDPNLESEVRASAQSQIQQAALADGILASASKNANATITSMLLGMGFQNVSVN